jgi:hypothetical protein
MMIVIEIFVHQIVYSNRKFLIFIHISYFKAGIDPELLTLAYEPEAAAISIITYSKCIGIWVISCVTDPCV